MRGGFKEFADIAHVVVVIVHVGGDIQLVIISVLDLGATMKFSVACPFPVWGRVENIGNCDTFASVCLSVVKTVPT